MRFTVNSIEECVNIETIYKVRTNNLTGKSLKCKEVYDVLHLT